MIDVASWSVTIKNRKGFTLIEVMVTVAVLAILSAIAYPLYESQSRKGKRPAAMALMEEVAQAEQRYFSHMNTFTITVTDLPGIKSATSAGGYYSITVAPAAAGSIANSFVVTAEPLTADQKKDSCQKLTLTDREVRGGSRIDSTGKSVSDSEARVICWGK